MVPAYLLPFFAPAAAPAPAGPFTTWTRAATEDFELPAGITPPSDSGGMAANATHIYFLSRNFRTIQAVTRAGARAASADITPTSIPNSDMRGAWITPDGTLYAHGSTHGNRGGVWKIAPGTTAWVRVLTPSGEGQANTNGAWGDGTHIWVADSPAGIGRASSRGRVVRYVEATGARAGVWVAFQNNPTEAWEFNNKGGLVGSGNLIWMSGRSYNATTGARTSNAISGWATDANRASGFGDRDGWPCAFGDRMFATNNRNADPYPNVVRVWSGTA